MTPHDNPDSITVMVWKVYESRNKNAKQRRCPAQAAGRAGHGPERPGRELHQILWTWRSKHQQGGELPKIIE